MQKSKFTKNKDQKLKKDEGSFYRLKKLGVVLFNFIRIWSLLKSRRTNMNPNLDQNILKYQSSKFYDGLFTSITNSI